MGTDQEPSWRASMDPKKWRRQRYRAGCARSFKASRAIHADYGPRVALRSGLRKDFTPVPRASGSVRRRIRPSMVQADAPRHGPDRAISWPARSQRTAAMARPRPSGESPVNKRAGRCWAENENPRLRPDGFSTGLDGMGLGIHIPRL